MRWDLFDRLVHFEDARLAVEFAYDALGRRLFKHSSAHYTPRREAGSQWNRNEQERKQRELGCGFTLYGWDGDQLAWESSPANGPVRLHKHPDWSQRSYDVDQDPLWKTHSGPQGVYMSACYQRVHLGTPMAKRKNKRKLL